MIKKTDMKWHVKKVNGIKTNPIECEYCIIDFGDGNGRIYRIEPKYEADENGFVIPSKGYKYFCFFEGYAEKSDRGAYSGYDVKYDDLIQVYDDMETAKKRAYTQYIHIYGYALAHVCRDMQELEEKNSTHFVV